MEFLRGGGFIADVMRFAAEGHSRLQGVICKIQSLISCLSETDASGCSVGSTTKLKRQYFTIKSVTGYTFTTGSPTYFTIRLTLIVFHLPTGPVKLLLTLFIHVFSLLSAAVPYAAFTMYIELTSGSINMDVKGGNQAGVVTLFKDCVYWLIKGYSSMVGMSTQMYRSCNNLFPRVGWS